MLFSVPSFALGFASGFGTGFVAREVTRVGTFAMRPFAKAMIKGGMMLVDKSRDAFAMAGETLEDLIAEARADLAVEGTMGEATPSVQHAGAGTSATVVTSSESRRVSSSGHDEEPHRAKAKKGHG
jgi:hypothetical protein